MSVASVDIARVMAGRAGGACQHMLNRAAHRGHSFLQIAHDGDLCIDKAELPKPEYLQSLSRLCSRGWKRSCR